jgi:hypothetical protein
MSGKGYLIYPFTPNFFDTVPLRPLTITNPSGVGITMYETSSKSKEEKPLLVLGFLRFIPHSFKPLEGFKPIISPSRDVIIILFFIYIGVS